MPPWSTSVQSPLSLVAASATPLDPQLKARITAVIESPERASLDEIGQIDVAVAHEFSKCTLELLRRAGVQPSEVAAVGSHGQTLAPSAGSALAFYLADRRSEYPGRIDRHYRGGRFSPPRRCGRRPGRAPPAGVPRSGISQRRRGPRHLESRRHRQYHGARARHGGLGFRHGSRKPAAGCLDLAPSRRGLR